jgi:hypothetical protein
MARHDGKNRFYKTLNLDGHSWNALKFYREICKSVNKNDKEDIKDNEDRSSQNNGE